MESPGDRLRKKREERGYTSARSAAHALGFSVPTFTSHENGTRQFDSKTAEKYAYALGTSAQYLLFGDRDKTGTPIDTKGVPVLGEAAVGVWRETDVDFMSQAAIKSLEIPMQDDPQKRAGRRFAVRVGDTSVNRVLLPGEFAVCEAIPRSVRFDPGHSEIGALLLVERTRRGLKEVTIRRVTSLQDGKITLTAHSTDARMTGAAVYPAPSNGERITILAKVVGKYASF